MNAVMDKWDRTEYRRIVSAELQGADVVIRFADGTWASVQAKRLTPAYRSDLNWAALTFTPYEIVVPAGSHLVEIPWSTVRILTDADYSAHVAELAEEEARQVGQRLRELREARNLSSKELAERAGITPQSLSRIEHGHHDVVFTTLRRLLAAMGCSVRDLAPISGPTEGGSAQAIEDPTNLGTSAVSNVIISGNKLKQARKNAGLDLKALAERLSRPGRTVRVADAFDWEKCDANQLDGALANDLACQLSVNLHDLQATSTDGGLAKIIDFVSSPKYQARLQKWGKERGLTPAVAAREMAVKLQQAAARKGEDSQLQHLEPFLLALLDDHP